MTIQALAWAMDQPVPGTAGRVLLALANHANHLTGRVDFDAGVIAGEASIRVPSLWRYLGALERNGYVAKESGKTAPDAEAREYWIALDRDPSQQWAWSQQDDGDRGDAEAVEGSRGPTPESAISTARGFDRAKQDEQRKVVTAPEPGRSENMFPVIEGSRAHKAWCEHLRARRQLTPYARTLIVNGRECRGFEMPSLFPPGGEETAA